jgi:hypothetical protein
MRYFLLLIFSLFASLFSLFASAAIDPSVASGIAAINTDAHTLSGIVVPVIVAIMALLIILKLIKRFGAKL